MRILIIKTSSLGDVIHTLPAVSDAAAWNPDIRFDWVVEEAFTEIPYLHPAVENVIPVAIRRWRKNLFTTWHRGEWRQFRKTLQSRRYDAVIDAQGLLKSAWLTRYCNKPVYGLDRGSAREPVASRFYSNPVSVARDQHAVERTRQLFAMALGYGFPQGAGQYGIDKDRLPGPGMEEPYVLFFHGTTWKTKHWPEAYWRTLAKQVAESGVRVVLPWGSSSEKKRAEAIAGLNDRVLVLPKVSLTELAGWLNHARAVVAVDTGLAHLAAALDVPTVSIYGPTNAGLTGSYGKQQIHLQSDFECSPCLSKRCAYVEQNGVAAFDVFPPCFSRVMPDFVFGKLQGLIMGGEA